MIVLVNRARLALAVFGFCLALGAIAFDNRPLMWLAIVSLSGALAIRLYLRRRTPPS